MKLNPIHKLKAFTLGILAFAAMASADDLKLQTDAETGELYVNMPAEGTDKLAITSNDIEGGLTSFKVYDHAGKNGDYNAWGKTGYLELSAPEGYLFQIMGDLMTYRYDYLTIYDGDTHASMFLNRATLGYGVTSWTQLNFSKDVGPFTSSGNALTIKFSIYTGYYYYPGFDLTVNLVKIPSDRAVSIVNEDSERGSVLANKTTGIAMGETVTLTATPNGDYELTDLLIKDCDNQIVSYKGGFYAGNEFTFEMPYCGVTVTPLFEKGSPFVLVPTSKYDMVAYDTVRVPTGMTSFKVYDNGGKNGNYRDKKGTLLLIAPKGFVFSVTGNVATKQYYDYMTIRDGGSKADTLLSTSGTNDIALIGMKDTMTFEFSPDKRGDDVYANTAGFDFTVSLISATEERAINITQAEGGNVTSDMLKAAVGEKVSLTLTPNTGYYLKSLVIKDELEKPISMNLASSFDNSVSFLMPATKVSVIPEWTSDLTAEGGLFMNMPLTGTVKKSIPANVKSFKLYDDGGKEKDYSVNADGSLELTAATDNHIMLVTGAISTESGYDYLIIYDGSTTSTGSSFTGEKDISFNSSGHVMTVKFSSDHASSLSGLDLTVTLLDKTLAHKVILPDEINGGSIEVDKASATFATPVTVTATPSKGYLVADVVVTADGKPVELSGDCAWYSGNECLFNMPYSDVVVTPVFTNGLTADELYINMPKTGTKTANIPAEVISFKVYDNGGKDGNYTYQMDDKTYLVLTAPSGYRIQLAGQVMTHRNHYLSVYDGDTQAEMLLNRATSTNGNDSWSAGFRPYEVSPLLSSGNTVTIEFYPHYNYARNFPGFDLTATLVPPEVKIVEVAGGTVTSDKSNARIGETVTLTANPSDGYMLDGVNIVDADKNVVNAVVSLFGKKAIFTMPASAVVVTPSWTDEPTAENGLFVNMPASGNMEVAVPSVVKSFYVYDDGGKDGDYSWNADGSLTLTVEDGYVMQVTGSVKTYGNSGIFKVLDGGADGKKIFEKNDNSFSITDVGTVTSKSNILTFNFKSIGENFYYQAAGLDLKVTLVKSEDHAIELVQSSDVGDVIAKDKETARWRDTVTITATSKKGHLLSSVEVLDADNNPVEAECGWYTGNKATFVMPNNDVTITPTFTDDLENLYVNMPTGGTGLFDMVGLGVIVPENVKKFKVYDDGGKDGDYGMGMALATFAAPEGSSLQMTGKVTLGGSDQLAIYKNSNGSVEILFASNESNAGKEVDVGVVHGDTLLLMFVRNGQNNAEGFAFDVKVISPDDPLSITPVAVTGGTVKCGTVECDKIEVKPGDVVTLTAEPEEGYLLTGFEVYDSEKHSFVVRGGDFVSNSGTFEMPSTDVFVKPLFTDDKSGLFVTMSASVDKFVTIPAGVTSFNVYDDGGKGGDKSANGAKTNLYITPAEGTAFQISGKVSLNSHWTRGVDSAAIVRVSDGAVLWSSNDRASGQKFDVPELVVGGAVRFYLYSAEDDLMSGEGFDFDVTVLDATVKYAIAIPSDGSVESDKVSASAGEIVTLTAKPGKGEILRGIEVSDDVKNMVRVDSGSWYSSNAATFTMPAADVTVAPSFTTDWSAAGGLYVNMPQAGLKNVTIPAGVTSFKVYDDGGKDENFTGLGYGEIVMTAPKGYVMQVSGTVIADGYGKLIVYDGDTDAGAIANVDGKIKEIDIGTKFTSGNKMCIYFGSKYSGDYDGIDLTVQLVESKMVNVATLDGKETAIINGNFAGKDAIEITTPVHVDSIAFQRNFSRNGFSTIVLPFEFSPVNLENVKSVIEFAGMQKMDNGDTVAGMHYVWCSKEVQDALEAAALSEGSDVYEHCNEYTYKMDAYTPYMVEMKNSKIGFKRVKDGITLKPTQTSDARVGDWVLRGTTEAKVFTKEETKAGTVWGFAAEERNGAHIGDFVRLGSGATALPLRAYMVFDPKSAPSAPSLVSASQYAYVSPVKVNKSTAGAEIASLDNIDVIIVSRDEQSKERTVIGTVNMRTGEFKMLRDYDSKGRKVNATNKARGAYYGKKVLKK